MRQSAVIRVNVLAVAIAMLLMSATALAMVRTGEQDPVAAEAATMADGKPGGMAGQRLRTSHPAPPGHPGIGATTAPVQRSDVEPTRPGSLALSLEVDPTCVGRGESGKATIHTERGVMLSLTVIYPDGSPHGAWYAGPVRTDGSLVFPFVVPVDVPTGRAQVLVAAVASKEKSARATAEFVVAGIGGCP